MRKLYLKKGFIVCSLTAAMCAALMSGCGNKTEEDTSDDTGTTDVSEENESTVYGKITEVGESSITINVGTVAEDETDAETSEDTEEESDEKTGDGLAISYTDEEQTIQITDDTTITGMSMGGGMPSGDGAGGDMGDGETPPDKPDGDTDGSEDTDDTEDGATTMSYIYASDTETLGSDDATPPDKPDGEESDEEAPSGDMGDGEKPDGEAPSGDMGDGEKPDGEAPSGDMKGGEMPDGEAPSGDMEGGEGGETQELTISDLSVDDVVKVTLDDDGNAETIEVVSSASGGMSGDMGDGTGSQSGGQSSGVDSYDAVYEYTSDTSESGTSYSSTGTDENAIHAYSGATVELSDITVDRTSSDSTGGDNSSFYGVGAAILESDGTLYIDDSTITTNAAGGAGVFAYGDGVVYVADTDISTSADTSGGIHVAGGGTLYAWDLNVETQGESSAAIRSDRGGGTMVVDGGTYVSNGTGSPAVYTTADITINDAALTANGSEAICIEGLNSLRLYDCDLTGNMADSSQNDCTWNVILYQSMSGDSEVGNSDFEMYGGTLTAKNGGMFYTTNTESTFIISDVDIEYADDSEFFLKCTGNSNERGWGETGANGADCTFTAIDQEMTGDVIWDSISELDFYMTEGSTLTGAIYDDEENAGNGGNGYCNVYIDDDSTWIVTGDSQVTELYQAGTIVDADGNTVTIQSEDGEVYVQGTSSYTITVISYYQEVDLSDAGTATEWSSYEVAKPDELD